MIKVAAAVVLFAIAAVVGWRNVNPPPAPTPQAYFYNLSTGELFAMPRETVSPATVSGGATALKAYVYACGECDAASRKVGYLEKYKDDVAPLVGKTFDDFDQQEAATQQIIDGLLVAQPPEDDEVNWIPAGSDAGMALINSPGNECGGQAQTCLP